LNEQTTDIDYSVFCVAIVVISAYSCIAIAIAIIIAIIIVITILTIIIIITIIFIVINVIVGCCAAFPGTFGLLTFLYCGCRVLPV
jgi:hypothetical protein